MQENYIRILLTLKIYAKSKNVGFKILFQTNPSLTLSLTCHLGKVHNWTIKVIFMFYTYTHTQKKLWKQYCPLNKSELKHLKFYLGLFEKWTIKTIKSISKRCLLPKRSIFSKNDFLFQHKHINIVMIYILKE